MNATQTDPESMLLSVKEELVQYAHELDNDATVVDRKFDDLREQLKSLVQEIQAWIISDDSLNREDATKLQEKLDSLKEHLDAEDTVSLRSGLSQLKVKLTHMVNHLPLTKGLYQFFPTLYDRAYRLMIKLEILGLKVNLGRLDFIRAMRIERTKFRGRVERWQDFRNELTLAYQRIHRAFTSHDN